jgi:DNA-binding PadR family transcriptional regulator
LEGEIESEMMSATQRERSCASIRSPVYWTHLGLIIERPDYGYGLMQRFEHEYGEAMPLSGNSVYEGLDVLQKAGLIEEYMAKSGRRRQPTPHYRATPEGVRAYGDWLMARVRIERRRSRLFARQLAALASEPQLGLEVIEHYERARLEEARADAIAHTRGNGSAGSGDSLAVALPAEQARLAIEVEVPWARYARARFTELSKTRVSPDGLA